MALQEISSSLSVAGLKHARQVGQVGLDDRVVRQQVGRLGHATKFLCLDAKLCKTGFALGHDALHRARRTRPTRELFNEAFELGLKLGPLALVSIGACVLYAIVALIWVAALNMVDVFVWISDQLRQATLSSKGTAVISDNQLRVCRSWLL